MLSNIDNTAQCCQKWGMTMSWWKSMAGLWLVAITW